MGATKRQATSGEVLSLRKENGQLKELLADHQVFKKAWLVWAGIRTSDAL